MPVRDEPEVPGGQADKAQAQLGLERAVPTAEMDI